MGHSGIWKTAGAFCPPRWWREVKFFIDYEFKSRTFQMLAGAVFEKVFRKMAEAFEARADRTASLAAQPRSQRLIPLSGLLRHFIPRNDAETNFPSRHARRCRSRHRKQQEQRIACRSAADVGAAKIAHSVAPALQRRHPRGQSPNARGRPVCPVLRRLARQCRLWPRPTPHQRRAARLRPSRPPQGQKQRHIRPIKCGGNANHRGFGRIGIGDEAAIEHIRRAGNSGECRSDHAAGARFPPWRW